MEDFYKTLGDAKSLEVFRKYMTLSNLYDMAKSGTRNPHVAGKVYEGIAKDFIKEFLPTGFKIKGGLIFDGKEKMLSPEIDAIIYSSAPLLEFTDAVVVEKEQVKAVFEVKSWLGTSNIFKDRELLEAFEYRRRFISPTAKYILFAFALESDKQDIEIINRLRQISDMYAVVGRKKPGQSWREDSDLDFDFGYSVLELIKYLRNLG